MSTAKHLVPSDHQRTGHPFRDGEIEVAREKALEKYRGMTLREILIAENHKWPEELQIKP